MVSLSVLCRDFGDISKTCFLSSSLYDCKCCFVFFCLLYSGSFVLYTFIYHHLIFIRFTLIGISATGMSCDKSQYVFQL